MKIQYKIIPLSCVEIYDKHKPKAVTILLYTFLLSIDYVAVCPI